MKTQIATNIINAIQKRVDEYEEIATDLAHDYIQSEKPFPTDLKQRYEVIGNVTEGLVEAIGIVMQCDYMLEDVDLSGGEEID